MKESRMILEVPMQSEVHCPERGRRILQNGKAEIRVLEQL